MLLFHSYYFIYMYADKASKSKYDKDRYAALTEEQRLAANARAAANTKRYKLRNTAYVNDLKASTPCADCGQFFDPICMDFDHVRGEKRKELSAIVKAGLSLKTVQEEIDKCEIVCACCHRLRTASRPNAYMPRNKMI